MNASATDHALLRDYAVEHSELAFAELVSRYIDLVYSTALRSLRDPDLARDVAQDVFTALAKKAHSLSARVVLSGWLYQATRYASAKILRAERRRGAREREAIAMDDPSANACADWERLVPELDAAIGHLGNLDRDAVLLRFFHGKDFKTVGATLGVSEGAAKKRVARAIGKLRSHLGRRGVSITETALIAALAGASAQAAPIGLAASVASASVVAASMTVGGSVAGAVVRIMASTKTKLGIIAAIGIVSIPLYLLWDQNRGLRVEVDRLRSTVAQRSRTGPTSDPGNMNAIDKDQLQRARREHLELLSLRGRVAQLSAELRTWNATAGKEPGPNASASPDPSADSILFTAALTNKVKNGATFVVGGWSNGGGRAYALITPTIRNVDVSSGEDLLAFKTVAVRAPESFWNGIGWGGVSSQTRRSTLSGVLTAEDATLLIATLRESEDAAVTEESLATSQEGGYVGLGWTNSPEDGEIGMLMMMELRARILPDTGEIQIELSPSADAKTAPVDSSLIPAGDQSRSP